MADGNSNATTKRQIAYFAGPRYITRPPPATDTCGRDKLAWDSRLRNIPASSAGQTTQPPGRRNPSPSPLLTL